MPTSTRHQARILAFQIIYNREKIGIHPQGEDLHIKDSGLTDNYLDFSRQLINLTWQHLVEIDKRIQQNLINWKQSRISETLNALLRIAACELIYFPETDGKIVLNEAIEICRGYVGEKATKICNGVLHAIGQNTQKPGHSKNNQ